MLGGYNLQAFVLTADAERAKPFYRDTLGLQYIGEDDYGVVFHANGIELRLVKMPGHKPTEHTVVGWIVPDVTAKARELAQAGVPMERYSFLPHDEDGVWTAPGSTTKVAWFKDPDGNTLSIAQH